MRILSKISCFLFAALFLIISPPGVSTAETLSVGLQHTVFLKADGSLWAWGNNTYGQLGDGKTTDEHFPVRIGTESNWQAVSAGRYYTVALKTDGSIWAWGNNTDGQLGDGTTTNRLSPVRIGTENDWQMISAGRVHTVALKKDGSLWAWGGNNIGQLGDGTTATRLSPARMGTESDWQVVSAGVDYTVALNDGSLWAWGWNNSGQLGNGTTANGFSPMRIGTENDWETVSAGDGHTVALKADGSLWAWGWNNCGQLGDGTTINRLSPVRIGTESDWEMVSAGNLYTTALKLNGSLWGWGNNAYGQLGDGTTTFKSSPIQLSTMIDWQTVSSRRYHTVALEPDGRLWAWGVNTYGQLGDGTRTTKYIPTRVNWRPLAEAGPDQSKHLGATVTLDGSGSSDSDGDYPLTYAWQFVTKPPESNAVLSEPASVTPSFGVDAEGDYTVKLVVTDALGLSSATDLVQISTSNTSPVADAGTDLSIVQVGTTVNLDGTQSYDDDGDPITYQWTFTSKPAGSDAFISDFSTSTPSFVADVNGTYVISLTVTDGWATSDADTVTVSFENVKPVADAGGNQSIVLGDTALFDGRGSSDANLDPLTYRWDLVSSPEGSQADLRRVGELGYINPVCQLGTQCTPTVKLVPDLPGTYVVSLVVNDGIVGSDPANATLTVLSQLDRTREVLQDLIGGINALDPSTFKNSNMANALTNKINAVLSDIEQGNNEAALDKLQNDILGKTDGCSATGVPDKNDWLKSCAEQEEVYPQVMGAIELLKGTP